MLDYIFFHQTPFELFIKFLQKHHIPCQTNHELQRSTDEESWTVSIDDGLTDTILEQVEVYYDEMMEMNETLISQSEANNEIKSAGISVTLSDGTVILADIDPHLIYKLSQTLSNDEIQRLVCAITDAVENPDMRPLCKR